jgi:hypothetical protein
MVGERGFEPPTPWSRTDNALYNQQLVNRNRGASIAYALLILIDSFQSVSIGNPIVGTLWHLTDDPSDHDHSDKCSQGVIID